MITDDISNGLDVIGDVHGHADVLLTLLGKLGYQKNGKGIHSHPEGRKAIFVGDILNRGPKVRHAIEVIRKMNEAGEAYVVLGNHEFNMLGLETKGTDGHPLRERNRANLAQFKRTKLAYRDSPKAWKRCLAWISRLPLSLEFQGLRIVHAAWHPKSLRVIAGRTFVEKDFLLAAWKKGSAEYQAVHVTLKGVKIDLPKDKVYRDRFGIPRKKARIRWWIKKRKKSYAELLIPRYEKAPRKIGPPTDSLIITKRYPKKAPPVFIGHYCLPPSEPKIQGNVVCVDGCVTCDGKLWAYRFDGERMPSAKKLVYAS